MLENDALQGQMLQTEKDTIDVITFLKKEDAVKDQHVSTVKPVLSGHSNIDKTKILMTNGS